MVMLLRLLSAVIIGLIATYAPAQGILLMRGGGYDYPDGTTNVTSTLEVSVGGGYVGDDVHNRYTPGGHAIGESPAALLLGNGSLTGAVIQTANYGSATSYRSIFSSLWIDAGETVNVGSVYANHSGDAREQSGIRLDSYSGGVYGCYIEKVKGWAIEAKRSTAITSMGAVGIPMSRIEGNDIARCFGGIKLESGDSFCCNNMCNQVRDHGLWITVNGGSNKVIGNHFYGCGADGSFAASSGESGCAARADYASFFADNDLSDSDIGLYVAAAADKTTVNNCRIQNNFTYGVACYGTTFLNNCVVDLNLADAIGIYVDAGAPDCQVIGGSVELTAATTTGIQVDGRQCHIDGVELDGSGASAQFGIVVNSPNMDGQVWHVTARGFAGTGAAVKILDWGSNNKIYITTDYTEGSDVPLRIDTAVWTAGSDSGNSVFIDGVEVTSGTVP